eukprot:Opistho-1_new@92734
MPSRRQIRPTPHSCPTSPQTPRTRQRIRQLPSSRSNPPTRADGGPSAARGPPASPEVARSPPSRAQLWTQCTRAVSSSPPQGPSRGCERPPIARAPVLADQPPPAQPCQPPPMRQAKPECRMPASQAQGTPRAPGPRAREVCWTTTRPGSFAAAANRCSPHAATRARARATHRCSETAESPRATAPFVGAISLRTCARPASAPRPAHPPSRARQQTSGHLPLPHRGHETFAGRPNCAPLPGGRAARTSTWPGRPPSTLGGEKLSFLRQCRCAAWTEAPRFPPARRRASPSPCPCVCARPNGRTSARHSPAQSTGDATRSAAACASSTQSQTAPAGAT